MTEPLAEPGRDRPDVETERDVQRVIDAFYGQIEKDPVIGSYFVGLDLANHLPRMYAFWSSIVFQTGTYRGRPLEVHSGLHGLTPAHFARWLSRFEATVDGTFKGDRAEHMKQKARQIAVVFQVRLGLESADQP